MAENNVVLKYCGTVDPEKLASYVGLGGFAGLKKAKELGQDGTIEEIKTSNVKGRGGAGFPCGIKLEMVRNADVPEKYLICNADEGEVGTFKDRYILQHDPFSLIEGIVITAYAVGAKKAYIYLRGEYRFLLDLLESALEQTRTAGYLDQIEIEIVQGAGAYICGEESALMNSIEGKRGESRFKPPFPTTAGLFGKPTSINNVETLVNITRILTEGGQWYANIGQPESAGTKVFSISGDVDKPGVYEVEMGTPLAEIIRLAEAKDIKLLQIGGATGRIVSSESLNTPVSYQTVLGAGGITVFDQSRDIIDIVYQTIKFLNEESCGFCTPCREGTETLLEIYERLKSGNGRSEDLESLERLCNAMSLSSLCGLGQAVPFPVMDSLTLFKQEYDVRIQQSMFLRELAAQR